VGDGFFISYRREDASGHAGRLYDYLATALGRSRVFMDVDAIAPGADFVARIDTALSHSRAMFVVIGPRWSSATDRQGRRRLDDPSDVVRREIAAALRHEILVIPVLVAGAAMPAESDLPDDLAPLATRNAFQLDDGRWSSDVERLLSALPTRGRSRVVYRRPTGRSIGPALFWVVFGFMAAVAILGMFLGVVAHRLPGLVGLPVMSGMHAETGSQLSKDLLFSCVNLLVGLCVAWFGSDDRTARWLAFGMVGTAAAFNVSIHEIFDSVAGRALFPAGTVHIVFHATVAAGYAYALMLFPDGRLPPVPAGVRSVLAGLALLTLALAFVLYGRSEGWVILYFGVVVVLAGGLALVYKARRLPSPYERERASAYLGAYITGAAITTAFAALSLAIQLHRLSPPDMPNGEAFAHDVVISLAPILTAIPIVLLVGLIRDRLWGVEDVANLSVLFGILIVVVLGVFTGLGLIVQLLSRSLVADIAVAVIIVVLAAVLAVDRLRGRIARELKTLLFGIDPDPRLAMEDLMQRLTTSTSVDDVVSAIAQVTRYSIGVTAGELEVLDADGRTEARWWPEAFRDGTLPRILLHSGKDVVGSVRVRKATRGPLTSRELASVKALATAAVSAVGSRSAGAGPS
jgi:TIR domain-containing protein